MFFEWNPIGVEVYGVEFLKVAQFVTKLPEITDFGLLQTPRLLSPVWNEEPNRNKEHSGQETQQKNLSKRPDGKGRERKSLLNATRLGRIAIIRSRWKTYAVGPSICSWPSSWLCLTVSRSIFVNFLAEIYFLKMQKNWGSFHVTEIEKNKENSEKMSENLQLNINQLV